MNVLQVMGCTSDQYASMERYLVRKAEVLSREDSRLVVVYENTPRSEAFVQDFRFAGGILEQCRLRGATDNRFHRQILALITKYAIRVAHGYFTPTCYHLALGLRLRGFNNIVRTAANMPLWGGAETLARDKMPTLHDRLKHRALARLFKKILCRSKGVFDAFLKLGVPASRLIVADGGCDTGRYRFQPDVRERVRGELGISDADLVLGVCCRLVPVKRLDRLIRLIARVKAKLPLRLLIAGDGPERERLESLTRDLKANRQVQFLGHCDDLSDLYSSFDIFCLPSEAEGMSNSILEAMSCQLPVLATDIPPNRGLVQPGRSGFLLSFEVQTEFKHHLRSLSSADVRISMGAFGRRLVEERFSIESRIAKEVKVYREVLGQA